MDRYNCLSIVICPKSSCCRSFTDDFVFKQILPFMVLQNQQSSTLEVLKNVFLDEENDGEEECAAVEKKDDEEVEEDGEEVEDEEDERAGENYDVEVEKDGKEVEENYGKEVET